MSHSQSRPVTRSRAIQLQPQPELELQPPTSTDMPRAKPQMNREVARLNKTPSFSETFNGRLEWKKRHYDKPVTSTPLAASKTFLKRVVTDEVEQIISPIQKKQPTVCIGLEVDKIDANRPPMPKTPTQTEDSIGKPTRLPLTPLHNTNATTAQPHLLPLTPEMKVAGSNIQKTAYSDAQADPLALTSGTNKETEPIARNPIKPPRKVARKGRNSIQKTASVPNREPEHNADNPNFSHFLVLYGTNEDDGPLHVDPNKITKTYASRKSGSFDEHAGTGKTKPAKQLKFLITKQKRASGAKCTKAPKVAKVKPTTEKIDPAALNWMEQTNKEFENIMNFPLCVQKFN